MTFLWGFLAGYWACFLLRLALNAWFRCRRAEPPTLRRKYRDDPMRGCPPGTQFHEVPATVKWEAKAADDGVRYELINLTGEER